MTAKRIGIFWMVDSQLITETMPLDKATPTYGICDIDADHYSLWEELQQSKPELRPYSYDYYARGRVVYDTAKKRFNLYADRCLICNERAMKKIRKAFGISPEECKIRSDSHYQCARCNPEYVSD